jgi:predicted  nucleic acid-binding Zn-ribbon protein
LKDEEHEMILNQYRALSVENTTLESHRTSLEREADTIRQSAREAIEQTSTLKTQLTRQSTLVKSYEDGK